MGLLVHVLRNDLGDCSNFGVSEKARMLCVVNVPGPFKPNDDTPAVELVQGPGGKGHAILRPAAKREGLCGPMFGGNFADTSDSRLDEAVRELTGARFYGALPIHDRFETWEEYEVLSR